MRSQRTVWLLALLSFVAYGLRTNIGIAQEYMGPDLGLSLAQLGVISAWGFQLAYAIFQIPAGLLGDRYGARLVLGLAVLGWSLASFATALVPAGSAAFSIAFGARVILGVSQAAMFPLAAVLVAQYVPAHQRVWASAVYLAGSSLGAALAPLTLAPIMVAVGWRAVFHVSATVGLAAAVLWMTLAPRSPDAPRATRPAAWAGVSALLQNRSFFILCASYFLHSAVFFVFVFWFFRYVTEARGFSILASAGWASVPYFMAVALAPLVGHLTDRATRVVAPGVARRRTAMLCLTLAAAGVAIGAQLNAPLPALFALGASVALLVSCEAPFWTTATALGGDIAGTAGGVLNLAGNLGGVFSIWLVPTMKDTWGWAPMLAFWAVAALVAAAMWMGVRPQDAR